MTKRQWIFPAISCLPLSMLLLSQYSIIGIILYISWFIRILFLKDKQTLIITLVVGGLLGGVLVYHHKNNVTSLNDIETRFVVYPESTTLQVEGDRIRFNGIVLKDGETENIVVSYRAETEAEKEKWLENSLSKHLLIEGELEKPSPNSNFFQFNYQAYLKRKNVHWQLRSNSIQSLNSESLPKPKIHYIEQTRSKILNYIDEIFHPKIGSYLKILFFADKRDISETALQNYRTIGVVHLFSISGFHISYLANVIRRFLLRLGITHERTNILVLFILPMYGALAGFGVSVFRAICQSTILTIGKIRKIEISTLNAWSLTMIITLFLNPYQVFDISFQLSYLLSLMFILMGNQQWIRELNPLLNAIVFSLMSGVASLPILAYHFFEIPWITAFANLLFIPFFTHVLFPALLILFASSIVIKNMAIFSFFNHICTSIIVGVENILAHLNEIFDFSFVIGRLPIFMMGLLIWSIFHLLKRIETKRVPNLLIIGLFLVSIFYYDISPVGYVLMLDIGQGDSILIKEPKSGKITMIDTGGRANWYTREPWQQQEDPFSIGKDVTVPALKSLGISTIDRLYITHADADHSGEIESIGQSMRIGEVAATKKTFQDKAVLSQLQSLNDTQLVIIQPPTIEEHPTNDTLIIHPMTDYKSKNNQSLVLYVKIGKDTWLFTGDIEEAERDIINTYSNLKTDYLKVAHHGSNTSTSQIFLNHIQAKTAFISAGRDNSFGHPNEEVIERLEEMDIQIFNTAENGAVMVKYLKLPFIDDWLTEIQTVY